MILTIKLPKDFEKRYLEYKAKLSDSFQEDEFTDHKFSKKLPRGIRWNQFIIEFLDDENVSITIREHKKQKASFIDMNFEDKRNGKPNQQWYLLKKLADYEGEIDWDTAGANKKLKKSIGLLADALRDYFSMDSDPFYPYEEISKMKNKRSYKTRFIIFCSQDYLANHTIQKNNDNLKQEIEDIFRDNTF